MIAGLIVVFLVKCSPPDSSVLLLSESDTRASEFLSKR